MHWDDDDIYGPRRLATQVAPIARGDADVTLLEHELTYFMADDALYQADMPWTHRPSWGPHFGTLGITKINKGGYNHLLWFAGKNIFRTLGTLRFKTKTKQNKTKRKRTRKQNKTRCVTE